MRLLFLLSFLAGFWSFISSDSSSTTTAMRNATAIPVADPNEIQSTNPSPGNTSTKIAAHTNIELTRDSVVNNVANSTLTPLPPSTTRGSKQTEMAKNVLTTSNEHQNQTHASTLPTPDKPVTTITRVNASGAALGSTSVPAVADQETNSIITKSIAVGSSQVPPAGSTEVLKESNSTTPTEPIKVTFAEIQNSSSARTNPTALTGGTKAANDKAPTSTPVNVQKPPANETTDSDMKVKNTTENSSGATGSVDEGVPQSSTTDVAQTSATSNIVTGDLKKKTDELKGNDTISSEAYCVADSRNQNYSLILMKSMDCETFVSGIGTYLAKQVCSELAKNADLQVFDKCVVQYSPAKDERDKMIIDVAFKVTDAWMNNILEKVKKESKDLKMGVEGRKERQSATELKKLIAMVVTGSLLLLVILSAIIYRCSQHKSKHKDPYLTEELRTVDNGCHDNPAMDVTDRESEMEEKSNSKATFLENTDGWIVPMDTHIKDDLEEEDTHL